MNNFLNKHKKIALISIILIVVLWFILPAITINHSHPFKGGITRFITITLIGCVAFAKDLIVFFKTMNKTKLLSLKDNFKQRLTTAKSATVSHMDKIISDTKKIKPWYFRRQEKRRLRKNPTYLIVGHDRSGSKSLLEGSQFHFLPPSSMSDEMKDLQKQTDQFKWWFNDHSAFVIEQNNTQSDNLEHYKTLTKLLKKTRRTRPINGVIVTFNISQLLLLTHEQRKDKISNIALRLKHLRHTLNALIPVYISFTMCDQISGFTEFFNDLSQEELTQIWGMTFNYNNQTNINSTLDEFNLEYDNLLSRLEKKVLFSLDSEKTTTGRELIQNFPQQMKLFKRPILTFISELNSASELNNLLIRGVYFTSSLQDSQTYDFLFSSLSSVYQLTTTETHKPTTRNESYFISELFQRLILSEGKYLGDNIKVKKLKQAAKTTTIFLTPVLGLYSIISVCSAYKSSKNMLSNINSNITLYQNYNQNLNPSNTSLPATLPQLNALNNIVKKTNHINGSAFFLVARHNLKSESFHSLIRSVHSIYIPRMAAQLENDLQHSENTDVKNLYVQLKGYLALGANKTVEPSILVAPIETTNDSTPNMSEQSRIELENYAKLAAKQPLDALPLNHPLLDKIRLRLQNVNLEERAFALLTAQSLTNQTASISVETIFPDRKIFNTNKDQPGFVSGLFTAKGFHDDYIPHHSTIAKHVTDDNRFIGLNSTTPSKKLINQSVSKLYNQRYQATWQNIIKNTSITKSNNMKSLTDQLNILSQASSPLKIALAEIANNTLSQIQNMALGVYSRF